MYLKYAKVCTIQKVPVAVQVVALANLIRKMTQYEKPSKMFVPRWDLVCHFRLLKRLGCGELVVSIWLN